MSVHEERARAVAETVAKVRGIERHRGVTRDSLESIKVELTDLASRTDLFPPEHFPVDPTGKANVYRISEDPDWRFALYASAGLPGKAVPPHNHTTWAAISGVYGDEHNVFYERTDNRGAPGRGTLRKTGEFTVRKGNAVAFMPDDFHTIEVIGDKPSLHLHMYGLSLERLDSRIRFASAEGGDYKVFPRMRHIANPYVQAAELKSMIRDGKELAILDAREEGVFSQGHLFFACSAPLSRLELRLPNLLPRRDSRIVVCDGGGDEGLAQKAAARMAHWGYRNVSVLRGGLAAWREAGYEVFSGVHVPSKAFGEIVEHACETPRMEAKDVKALMDSGRDMIVLDSRPMDEFRKMSIPTGIDCPGAELVHRVHDLVPSPDTLVVVNCAGRTRSIIGAQSLINAGLPNEVVALKNGTMGWHLAGLRVAKGETKSAPPPSAEGRAKAREAAFRVGIRAGIRYIDAATLDRFSDEADHTALYVFDVRSPEEYAAGHRPGSVSAPGGQLVQATDLYAAIRGARIVLVDDDGTRATMTGSWLMQMGWTRTYVLEDGLKGVPLEIGPPKALAFGLADAETPVETISPAALKDMLDRGAAVAVDLETSIGYREGHIPGAAFAVRSRFAASLGKLPKGKVVAMTSPDGVLARLAAPEAAEILGAKVVVLDGGTAAWAAARLPLAAGEERMLDATDDVWYRPYDRNEKVEDRMKAYLDWEVDLIAQIQRDGDAVFKVLRP